MELNIIFLAPMSKFLNELKENLPESEGFVLYELDSINEYKQVVDFLPKSITFTSDLKLTQNYLSQVSEVMNEKSYNIMISDRDIPLTLNVKLSAQGLNDILHEDQYNTESLRKVIIDYFNNTNASKVTESLKENKSEVDLNKEKKKPKMMRLERGISITRKSKFDFDSRKIFSLRDPEQRQAPIIVKDLNFKDKTFSKNEVLTLKGIKEVYHYNLHKIKTDKNITEVEKRDKLERLVNTYIDEFSPPEYTREVLRQSPQKIEDLLEDNCDRFLGDSSNLEFLVFVSEFYKYKEPNNESITRFIHLSFNSLVPSETSFFKLDGEVELLHSYHEGNILSEDELLSFLDDIKDTIEDLTFEYWFDEEFKEKENFYIYPYFENDKITGFSITHFDGDKIDFESKEKFETFASLARGIFI